MKFQYPGVRAIRKVLSFCTSYKKFQLLMVLIQNEKGTNGLNNDQLEAVVQ
jgi:hypothetical protein